MLGRPLAGAKVVHPQVLFRGGGNPFGVIIGNDTPERRLAWRGLRVLERMVIMEWCILTMFITKGARHHNLLSADFFRRVLSRFQGTAPPLVSSVDNAETSSSLDYAHTERKMLEDSFARYEVGS